MVGPRRRGGSQLQWLDSEHSIMEAEQRDLIEALKSGARLLRSKAGAVVFIGLQQRLLRLNREDPDRQRENAWLCADAEPVQVQTQVFKRCARLLEETTIVLMCVITPVILRRVYPHLHALSCKQRGEESCSSEPGKRLRTSISMLIPGSHLIQVFISRSLSLSERMEGGTGEERQAAEDRGAEKRGRREATPRQMTDK